MSTNSNCTPQPLWVLQAAAGLKAARAVAEYHIGDSSWADMIIDAYLLPENAMEELKKEMEE